MLFKTTTRLFRSTYQYKIVLVCAGAQWFRNNDMGATLDHLKQIKITGDTPGKQGSPHYHLWRSGVKTQDDLDYAFKLQNILKSFKDIYLRVETPWITVYTNEKSYVDKLIKVDPEKIKYICIPPANTVLDKNTVIMPNRNFDYKVTLGKTTGEHDSFIAWAEKSDKLKMTKSCKTALSKNKSWGGTHFYVSGENNLLMAKMHLGGSILKIERIIKEKA
jgi:hypothetical protein